MWMENLVYCQKSLIVMSMLFFCYFICLAISDLRSKWNTWYFMVKIGPTEEQSHFSLLLEKYLVVGAYESFISMGTMRVALKTLGSVEMKLKACPLLPRIMCPIELTSCLRRVFISEETRVLFIIARKLDRAHNSGQQRTIWGVRLKIKIIR